MARTVTAIQQEIINNVQGNEVLSEKLTSTSKTAIWRLTAYVVAVAIWALEKLFDAHTAEVSAAIANKRPQTLPWYADMAKRFQYGYALPRDTDIYPVIDESAMIVAQASVTEAAGKLRMKVAKKSGDTLAPLSTANPDELTPFTDYVGRWKGGGVVVNIISAVGDDLRLVMDIWYDPLVLDATGKLLIDGTTEPAKEAIKQFITSLDFDGEFVPALLVDALQATVGIDIPVITSCETKFAENDWSIVDGKVIPNAGYLTIADENLTINYRANV